MTSIWSQPDNDNYILSLRRKVSGSRRGGEDEVRLVEVLEPLLQEQHQLGVSEAGLHFHWPLRGVCHIAKLLLKS